MVLSEALYAGAHVASLVKPMDVMPPEFHHIKIEADMIKMITGLLSHPLNHEPVLIYPIETVADNVAGLFNYSAVTV